MLFGSRDPLLDFAEGRLLVRFFGLLRAVKRTPRSNSVCVRPCCVYVIFVCVQLGFTFVFLYTYDARLLCAALLKQRFMDSIYMHTYIHIHICIDACTYINIYASMHVHTYVCLYACMYLLPVFTGQIL